MKKKTLREFRGTLAELFDYTRRTSLTSFSRFIYHHFFPSELSRTFWNEFRKKAIRSWQHWSSCASAPVLERVNKCEHSQTLCDYSLHQLYSLLIIDENNRWFDNSIYCHSGQIEIRPFEFDYLQCNEDQWEYRKKVNFDEM